MVQISVVLATYNRAELLSNVLNYLKNQTISDSFFYEVIVVDNASTDNTKAIFEKFLLNLQAEDSNETKRCFRYIFEPKQGKSHALNRGIKEATGDIIAFTDDDVTIDSKWLLSIVNCFKENDCDCVGGRVLPVYPENTPKWVKEQERQMAGVVVVYDYGKETRKYDSSMDIFIGANFAFKKQVFDECGLFHVNLSPGRAPVGEDLEFVERLIDKEKSIYYCGSALMMHPVDLERLKFKMVANWHKELGRYSARREYEREGKDIKFWFGIPRYLMKGIVTDFFRLIISIFNQKLFFNSTRSYFRKLGMIQEYRSIQKENG